MKGHEMQHSYGKQLAKLSGELREQLIEITIEELRAKFAVDNLQDPKNLDPKALGAAYGRLMEIKGWKFKLMYDYFMQPDSWSVEMTGEGSRNCPPPLCFEPTPAHSAHIEGSATTYVNGDWTITLTGGSWLIEIWQNNIISELWRAYYSDGTWTQGWDFSRMHAGPSES